MRLRRITEHVKSQNWFAVGLDFVIVVVGVFIGIQVANWNDARQDHIQAARFLDRLEAEFVQQIAQSERGIASHQQSLQANSRLINGVRAGALDEERLLDDISKATTTSTPPGPSTAFQEFVSSGQTDLIRGDSLRSALYEFNSYVSLVRAEFGSFTAPVSQASDALMRAQTIKATGIPSKDFDQLYTAQSVDSSILLSDPEIKDALQKSYGTHDNILLVLVKIREQMEVILSLIETEQERAK